MIAVSHHDDAAARAAWRAYADGLLLQADATDAGRLVLLADLLLWLIDATGCDRPAAVHRLADALEHAARPAPESINLIACSACHTSDSGQFDASTTRTRLPLFMARPGAFAMPADGECFDFWTPAALAAERQKCKALPPAQRRAALAYCDDAQAVAPGFPAALQLLRTAWAACASSTRPPVPAAVFAWGKLPGLALAMRAADVPALGLPVGCITVNAAGLAEIAAFLGRCHKRGRDHFTPAMLRAWAADAEFQLSEGNAPTIEIRSFDTLRGHTETHTVSAAGLSWQPPGA